MDPTVHSKVYLPWPSSGDQALCKILMLHVAEVWNQPSHAARPVSSSDGHASQGDDLAPLCPLTSHPRLIQKGSQFSGCRERLQQTIQANKGSGLYAASIPLWD